MKKVLFLLLFFVVLGAVSISAQVRIGGDAEPEKGAVLDLNASAPGDYVGGLLLPNVQLTALSSFPADFTSATEINDNPTLKTQLAGLLIYNTGGTYLSGVYVWNGTEWKRLNAV